jgi:hypothetical protein
MKRLLVFVSLVIGLALAAAPAFAHVHGLAPLNAVDCEPQGTAGGNRADDEDNPIAGLIPVAVGSGANGNIPSQPANTTVDAATANAQCPSE